METGPECDYESGELLDNRIQEASLSAESGGRELAVSCSEKSLLNSNAVVQFSALPHFTNFALLQANTNLNDPPSNWLRSSSRVEKNLQDFTHKRADENYSSIDMANSYPDMVGEVDIISYAQNIKKLLKMPYSQKCHVSMVVHRVGKTLLLDDFDIHKHLLRKQQDDWNSWMNRFNEEILQDMLEKVPRKNKSRDHLQNMNMLSKFLYYSLANNDENEADSPHHDRSEASCPDTDNAVLLNEADSPHHDRSEASCPDTDNAVLLNEADSPHHDRSEASCPDTDNAVLFPDPLPKPVKNEFHREVLWTFEDVRMLVGTDLPIFGGGTHPCVSLRLRDKKKPIKVLTGLDYWLDNLMCNVPELAMCYHLDGIVQKYELIKTEDIPTLENSSFDPSVVYDIARNILSFLKTNATKEGHTYWLFKGVDDDVVKLYDLTMLMDGQMEQPFSAPVGMLLYRVARNMIQRTQDKHVGTITMLLEQCLLLLDENHHSQICVSARYLLSDLYVPDSAIQDVWLEMEDPDSESETDDSEQSKPSAGDPATVCSVDVNGLCVPVSGRSYQGDVMSHPPLSGNISERCQVALSHIQSALVCLNRSATEEPSNSLEGDYSGPPSNPGSPDRSQPIPLHYSPLSSPTALSDQTRSPDHHKPNKPIPLHYSSLSSPIVRENCDHKPTDRCELEQPKLLGYNPPKTIGDTRRQEEVVDQNNSNINEPIPRPCNPLLSSSLPSETESSDQCPSGKDVSSVARIQRESSDQCPSGKDVSSVARIQRELNAHVQVSDALDSCGSSVQQDHCPIMEVTPEDEVSTLQQDLHKEILQVSTAEHVPAKSWHQLSRTLLLWKATVSYYSAARVAVSNQDLGHSLKYTQLALQFWDALMILSPKRVKSRTALLAALLSLRGDLLLMLATQSTSKDEVAAKMNHLSASDKTMMMLADVEARASIDFSQTKEFFLKGSLDSYSEALTLEKSSVTPLLKRFGNVHNELGTYYLSKIQDSLNTAITQKQEPTTEARALWETCFRCFTRGVDSFDMISDRDNLALVYSNIGRLMRMCAQEYTQCSQQDMPVEFSANERHFYTKAIAFYQKSLTALNDGKHLSEIGNKISWELSTTYLNMAVLIQDHAPVSTNSHVEAEKEVVDLMTKSLRCCSKDTSVLQQPLYQYRAATVNHRLASLFHSSYRNQTNENKKRYQSQLAEGYYEKAYSLFLTLDCCCKGLCVQLERVALCEFHLEANTHSKHAKWHYAALDHVYNCCGFLTSLRRQLVDDEADVAALLTEGPKLVNILQARIQFQLLNLAKNAQNGKKTEKAKAQGESLKRLYSDSLREMPRIPEVSCEVELLRNQCTVIIDFIHKLKKALTDS